MTMMNAPVDLFALCSQLQAQMKEKILQIERDETNLVVQYNKAIVIVVSLLRELKTFVIDHKFKDQAEEIRFFKKSKPLLLSQYFFYEQLLSIKMHEPPRLSGGIHSYYVRQLDQLQEFDNKYSEFIGYCLSDENTMDDKYFVRGFIPAKDFLTDQTFSTGFDELLSHVIANRQVKEFILAILETQKTSDDFEDRALTWTGSKADLIELIYGLEAAGAINKGATDIKEIARRFENLFNISLGNLYRQFLDIRLRKKERTVFLNRMKDTLEARMDDFR